MSKQRITTSATPHITIEACGGDLAISGAAELEVLFDFDADGDVQREGESLHARSGGDCSIACPPGSSITVQTVGGDFSAADLKGTLAVAEARSDASVRSAGVVTFTSVGGDLSVRDLTGELHVEKVSGDLEVRRIDGKLSVSAIGGDLSARSLESGFDIAHVGGDASIETELEPGKTYRVNTDGDLTLRVPSATDAHFTLKAGGEIERGIEFDTWEGNSHAGQGKIGGGEAQVKLSAGGDLTLLPMKASSGFTVDFDAIGSQIEAKMSQFERELESKMHDLSEQIARMTSGDIEARLQRMDVPDASRRAAERARERAERLTERVREKAERARRQAERAAERARRRSERASRHRHGFGFNFDFPSPWTSAPASAKAAKAAATEEERLMILRMLQEHKISADEAAKLLEALES